MEKDIVTIIYADTYGDSYGIELEIFGIATTKKDQERICKEVSKMGYYPITEQICLNELSRIDLGGSDG